VSLARNRLREARAYATVVTTLFESTKSAAAAAAILKEYPEKAK
jgi:hypothetical protein